THLHQTDCFFRRLESDVTAIGLERLHHRIEERSQFLGLHILGRRSSDRWLGSSSRISLGYRLCFRRVLGLISILARLSRVFCCWFSRRRLCLSEFLVGEVGCGVF